MIIGQVLQGLTVGAAYSLLAVAIVLVYNGTRVLAIALGEIGAFALYAGLHLHSHSPHVPVAVSALVAIALGAVLGLGMERLVMRPLVGRPPLDAVVANLGVALLLALLELRLYGYQQTDAPSPVGGAKVQVLGAFINAPEVAALVLAGLVAAGLYLFLTRTRFGLATRAATSDPTVARLLGVKVNSVYRFTWVTAGALAGLTASLLSPIVGTVTPFGLTSFLLSSLAGAVVGGLDSFQGAIVGSLLVGVVVTVVGPRYGDAYGYGAVLVLVLVTLTVRPRGLLGSSVVS